MMLTVWTFPTPYGAEAVVSRLHALAASELIRLGDAALVTWPSGRTAPIVEPLADLQRSWMLDDAFWGVLAGALFHCPQPAAASDAGDPGQELAALGLNAAALDAMRTQVVAGTSALLLIVEAEVARRIAYALDGMPYQLTRVPLSAGQAQRLRSTFSSFEP